MCNDTLKDKSMPTKYLTYNIISTQTHVPNSTKEITIKYRHQMQKLLDSNPLPNNSEFLPINRSS